MLLEVVLSLSLFVAGATVLGQGFNASIRSVGRIKLEAAAADMVVTLVSELQMGLVDAVDAGPTVYDEPLAEWSWQVVTESVEQAPDIQEVHAIVRHEPTGLTRRLVLLLPAPSDEEAEESGDVFDAMEEPAPEETGGRP